jgi:hypothetical protein
VQMKILPAENKLDDFVQLREPSDTWIHRQTGGRMSSKNTRNRRTFSTDAIRPYPRVAALPPVTILRLFQRNCTHNDRKSPH